MKRLFRSKSDRNNLYERADGSCVACGSVLGRDWHADHMVPWSKGGATELDNGQAMCPACNLKKGSKMVFRSREYQVLMANLYLERVEDLRRGDKVHKVLQLEGTMGIGKTFAYGLALKPFIDAGDQAHVYVPTHAIRDSVYETLSVLGLRPFRCDGSRPFFDKDEDRGVALFTYASLAKQYRHHTSEIERHRRHVVLDEIHHCGDEKAFGIATESVLGAAAAAIAGTGTPVRSDGTKIAGLRYEDRGGEFFFAADVRVTVEDAIRNGWTRRLVFRYHEDGEIVEMVRGHEGEVTQALEDREGGLYDICRLEKFWQPLVMQAHENMNPDYGDMLIVTADTNHANKVGAFVKKHTGRDVTVVHTGEGGHDSKALKAFRKKKHKKHGRVLVAVGMASEGYDCCTLDTGVCLSNKRASLFVWQFFGRFLRPDPKAPKRHHGTVYGLGDALWRTHCETFELDQAAGIKERERIERESRDMGDRDQSATVLLDARFGDMTSVMSGERFDHQRAQEISELTGVSIADIVSVMRASEIVSDDSKEHDAEEVEDFDAEKMDINKTLDRMRKHAANTLYANDDQRFKKAAQKIKYEYCRRYDTKNVKPPYSPKVAERMIEICKKLIERAA